MRQVPLPQGVGLEQLGVVHFRLLVIHRGHGLDDRARGGPPLYLVVILLLRRYM